MYCRGSEQGVREWVATVQRLRYKDFQLVSKPAMIEHEPTHPESQPGLIEVESVKEFGDAMERRGISEWWKRAMDFA